jgi:hypothetical protein
MEKIKEVSDKLGEVLDKRTVKMGNFEPTVREWILGVPALAMMSYALLRVMNNEVFSDADKAWFVPAMIGYAVFFGISKLQEQISNDR